MKARITAIGSYVPEKVMTNHDFAEYIETSDEWIVKRTGIKERRITADDEYTTDLSYKAVLDLQNRYPEIDLSDVDFVMVATSTQEHVMPSVASQLQGKLGIKNTGAVDVTAACAGFAYVTILAKALVESGVHKKVLIIGAENISRYTDFTDRTTCILFGDGAGAVLVEVSEEDGILSCVSGSEGEDGHVLYLSATASSINGVDIINNNKIHQDGRKVFKWAVSTVSREAQNLLDKAGLKIEDIDWFVPHSANMRIVEAVCRNLGHPVDKVLQSLEKCGNTSSASIPLAISEGVREGKVKKGDKILTLGFGSGLTYAGTIIKW